MTQKMRVGLIFGGRSGEHEVSVLSAKSVMEAIDPNKYIVYPIGITKQGQWVPGVSPQAILTSGQQQVLPESISSESKGEVVSLENTDGYVMRGLVQSFDVVIPILHGPFGEDGTIQGLLELAGLPYVGGGVLASALGMDKSLMKKAFLQEGLPVGDFLTVLRVEWEQNPEGVLEQIESRLGLPCFVKPANLGSSVGISKAFNRKQLQESLDNAASYDRKLVIEAFISGREIECSVLGNDDPIASVPGEIVPGADFYDYDAKYVKNDSKLIIPADLPKEVSEEVKVLAVRAFKAIDCAGLARVDFFVSGDQIVINEINTIPGFTRISMYPKLWEASGIPYAQLIERLIQLALERHKDRQRNRIS